MSEREQREWRGVDGERGTGERGRGRGKEIS